MTLEKLVGPRQEVLPVRRVGVAAIVLAPGELAVEQADVHGRHLLGRVVVGAAEVLRAEQTEHRLRRDRGHEAALMIEPLRVALLGNAVAHEREPRRAERDQLVRVDRNVAGVLAAERRFRRAVLEEVAGHPVILAGPVRLSTASPQLRRCSLAPPSPDEPMSTTAKRGSNAIVTSAALP